MKILMVFSNINIISGLFSTGNMFIQENYTLQFLFIGIKCAIEIQINKIIF